MVNFHAEVNICSCPILIVGILMFFFINLIFMSLSKKEIYKGVVTKFFYKTYFIFIINGSHGTLHEVINIRLLLMVKKLP